LQYQKRKGFKMRTLTLTATLMLLTTLTLGADTIDEQIASIAAATPEDRVILVNEFKETLSTLTTEERAAAISELRATCIDGEQVPSATQTGQGLGLHLMQQTEDMQTQVGTQVRQQNGLGGGAGNGGIGGQGQHKFGNK
jgi:hypothetical protein